MTKLQQQKGFTLVELAIVLTIIGLLIGGILKGQQLMQNARVTATIAQVKAIEAATTSFRDFYNAMPGDLKNGQSKIPNCTAACTLPAGTVGDGFVGTVAWDMQRYQSVPAGPGAVGAGGAATDFETVLFWYELEKAGLISAVTDAGVTGGSAAFGKALPAARLGGGFWAGNSDGSSANLRLAAGGNFTLLGTILTMVDVPDGGGPGLTNTSGAQAMTPAVAAQIDRKIDDGIPATGGVQPYGVAASCYGGAAAVSPSTTYYDESVNAKDCGLHLRIQQ